MVRPALLCPITPMIRSIKFWPSMGNSALGRPMRLDSPAERTTAMIIFRSRSLRWTHLLVDLSMKADFSPVHVTILSSTISSTRKVAPGFTRQRLFDLNLGSFPGYQWDSVVNFTLATQEASKNCGLF